MLEDPREYITERLEMEADDWEEMQDLEADE